MDYLNIVVMTPWVQEGDEELLFGPLEPKEKVHRIGVGMLSMWRLLVLLGAFPSISQARKNWKDKSGTIPPGFSEFWVGKKRRRLTIWSPQE